MASAPKGYWSSIASDATGQYLAATQYMDSDKNPGSIYTYYSGVGIWSQTYAPSGYWSSIASDATGQYLAASQYYSRCTGNKCTTGYIYTFSPGNIYIHCHYHNIIY